MGGDQVYDLRPIHGCGSGSGGEDCCLIDKGATDTLN